MFNNINTNKYPLQQTSGFPHCSREMVLSPLSVTYPKECVVCGKMVINTKNNSIIVEGESYHRHCHMQSIKNVRQEKIQNFGSNQPRMMVPNLSSLDMDNRDNNNNNNNAIDQPSFYRRYYQQQLQQPIQLSSVQLQHQQQVYNNNNNQSWFNKIVQ